MTEMPSLKDQFTTLKNHFGALVSTVRDLKRSVEDLHKKCDSSKNTEVQEVLETQRVFEKVIVSNSDAIQKLKSEIVELKGEENPAEVSATFE